MPEIPPPDRTEELLRGADRPRPLPPELHQRLVDRLTEPGRADATGGAGAPGTAGARPLPSDLRARLEDALPSEPPPEEAPDAGAAEERRWRTSRWLNPVTAVAAALLLVVAVVGLSLHGSGTHNPRVAATNGTAKGARGLPPSASLSASGAGGAAGGTGGGTSGGSVNAGAGPLNSAAGSATGQSAAGSGASGGAASGGASSAPAPAAAPAPPPSVSAVSPSSGTTAGGTWVTVTGQNLGGATQVRFGTTPARQLVVVSGTVLRALTPAHALGPVDVTVMTPGGTSPATPGDRYTFLP